jgi:hypothetical protein
MGGGVWASSLLFGCLIVCFVLILSLCIFLENAELSANYEWWVKNLLYAMTVYIASAFFC